MLDQHILQLDVGCLVFVLFYVLRFFIFENFILKCIDIITIGRVR